MNRLQVDIAPGVRPRSALHGKIRVAMVGAGYVSTHHIRAIRGIRDVEIVGICDADVSRAEEVGEKFSIPVRTRSFSELLQLSPDVVHVLTPPASHCRLTLEALEGAAHVFVEKPMAESVDECRAMVEKASAMGLALCVDHSARFDPAVQKGLEYVRSGRCGDVLAVHFIRSSDYAAYPGGPLPPPFRQGSYPFRDLGVHGLYLLEAFLGPVQQMRTEYFESGRDPLLTFDEWRVQAQCERGTGYMFLSWNSRPIQNEIWVQGTRATVRIDCFLQTCDVNPVLPGPKQIGLVVNGFREAVGRSFAIPWNMLRFATGALKPSPGIYRAIEEFYVALKAGAPVPVPEQEAIRAIYWVGEAAARADQEKEERMMAQRRPPEPARVLVTGASGVLGGALVGALRERGEHVRVLLRKPPKRGHPTDAEAGGRGRVSVVHGSLGQPDVVDRAVAGAEIVYHVGAAMKGGPAEFEQATIWGTRNIIESCLRHNVKRLVYVSSLTVLDHAGHRSGEPVTETAAYEPHPDRRGLYTQTKLEAENLVLQAVKERGLQAVILRPGQIFGPGYESVAPSGVIAVAGRWIVAGFGRRALPLVFRDDVVDALLLAGEGAGIEGRVFSICDGEHILQHEYLAHLPQGRRAIRCPVPLLVAMSWGVELLGAVMRRGVPLTRYRVRSLRPLHPVDTTAAESVLGWKPRVGVREGMRRTFSTEPHGASPDRAVLRRSAAK